MENCDWIFCRDSISGDLHFVDLELHVLMVSWETAVKSGDNPDDSLIVFKHNLFYSIVSAVTSLENAVAGFIKEHQAEKTIVVLVVGPVEHVDLLYDSTNRLDRLFKHADSWLQSWAPAIRQNKVELAELDIVIYAWNLNVGQVCRVHARNHFTEVVVSGPVEVVRRGLVLI